jgi:hypothetical protein
MVSASSTQIPRGILAEALLVETPPDLAAFLDRHFQAAVLTVEETTSSTRPACARGCRQAGRWATTRGSATAPPI